MLKILRWFVLVPFLVVAQQTIGSEGLKLPTKQFCQSTSINITLRSRHLDQRNQNEDNFGLGVECQFVKDLSLEVGEYRNSGRHTTKHAGVVYEPVEINKNLRLGVATVLASGYVSQQECSKYYGIKDPFFGDCYIAVVLPTLRWTDDSKKWGMNFYYIPAAGGVFGVQARIILR